MSKVITEVLTEKALTMLKENLEERAILVNLLVEAGIDPRLIKKFLEEYGYDPEEAYEAMGTAMRGGAEAPKGPFKKAQLDLMATKELAKQSYKHPKTVGKLAAKMVGKKALGVGAAGLTAAALGKMALAARAKSKQAKESERQAVATNRALAAANAAKAAKSAQTKANLMKAGKVAAGVGAGAAGAAGLYALYKKMKAAEKEDKKGEK